jgi:hypothetical protein
VTNTTLTLPLLHSRTHRAPTLASHCAQTSEAPPPSVVVTYTFRRRSWALAVSVALVSFSSASVTWDTLQFTPSPSNSLWPHSLFLLRAVAAPPPPSRPLAASLPLFKGPKDFPRGNQPPPPCISLPRSRLCAIAHRSEIAPPPSHPVVDCYPRLYFNHKMGIN